MVHLSYPLCLLTGQHSPAVLILTLCMFRTANPIHAALHTLLPRETVGCNFFLTSTVQIADVTWTSWPDAPDSRFPHI